MKSDLTIILLLKDRHEFNERIIKFFLKNKSNYYLFISDGGKKKLNKKIVNKIKNNKFIKYFRFPQDKSYHIFYKKIYRTLKLIKTKYFIFLANDDFLIYKSLYNCLNFLKKNRGKGYIGAGGTMLGFECLRDKKGLMRMSNFINIYKYIKLDYQNKIKRFNTFIKNYNDLPRNCILDKTVMLNIYKRSINLFDNNIEFKDHFTNLFTIIQGKIKIFNKILVLHEAHSENSEGNFRSKIILQTFKNDNFFNDLSIFDKILSKKLKKNNYVVNKYYKYVLSKHLEALQLKSEPSINEIKKYIFKKLERKIFKTRLKKKQYNNKNKIDKDAMNTINFVEKKIIN